MDQEMATNIMDLSRRKGAIVKLKEKLAKLNSLKNMDDYETTS